MADNLEKKVSEWLADVSDRIGADRVGDILAGALVGAARTKATLDRNFESLLSMANIPSQAEMQKLRSKIDSLQGTIMNLSRRIDQLDHKVGNGATARRGPSKSSTKTSKAAKTASRARKAKPTSAAKATVVRKAAKPAKPARSSKTSKARARAKKRR